MQEDRTKRWMLGLIALLAGAQCLVYVGWALFDLWPFYVVIDWLENQVPLIVIAPEG